MKRKIVVGITGASGAPYARRLLGVLRQRLPTLWDTVDPILILVTIPLNAATGRADATAYWFWAAAYCVLGLCAVNINLRQATREATNTIDPS